MSGCSLLWFVWNWARFSPFCMLWLWHSLCNLLFCCFFSLPFIFVINCDNHSAILTSWKIIMPFCSAWLRNQTQWSLQIGCGLDFLHRQINLVSWTATRWSRKKLIKRLFKLWTTWRLIRSRHNELEFLCWELLIFAILTRLVFVLWLRSLCGESLESI